MSPDPVRRAADGDRSAPQMEAAAQAQGSADRFHNTLVYVTHDQNEALTSPRRSLSCMTARSCSWERRRSCSSARRTLRRLLHRFAGDEHAALPTFESDGVAGSTGPKAVLGGPGGLQAASGGAQRKLELGIRPELIRGGRGSPRRRCRLKWSGVEDLGNYKLVTPHASPRPKLLKAMNWTKTSQAPVRDGAFGFARLRAPLYAEIWSIDRLTGTET